MNNKNAVKIARHEFDLLTLPRKVKIKSKICTVEDVSKICQLTGTFLPGEVASAQTVENVILHNENSILGFSKNNSLKGLWAMLMLNPRGLEHLLLGELNTLNPPVDCLISTNAKPAAIYIWATVAPGIISEGIKHASQFLRQSPYTDVNLFSRPNTEVGIKLNHSLGLRPVSCGQKGLYRYIRLQFRDKTPQ